MSSHPRKTSTGLALKDCALSLKASIQSAFGRNLQARQTLRELLTLRQSYLAPDHKSRASAQIALAETYLDGNIVDRMQADALLSEAQLILIKHNGAMQKQVARVLHIRGRLHTSMADKNRAHTFHQAAETVYERIRPLSFERVANLRELAHAQAAIGLYMEAKATRKTAEELNRILLLQSVRRRY